MKPDKAGIWEWFEKDGTKRLMSVVDVEHDTTRRPYLRVYWWGGYYNVRDEPDNPGPFGVTEWPDRWGSYIGPIGSVEDKDLYLGPTPEQTAEIKKQYERPAV